MMAGVNLNLKRKWNHPAVEDGEEVTRHGESTGARKYPRRRPREPVQREEGTILSRNWRKEGQQGRSKIRRRKSSLGSTR